MLRCDLLICICIISIIRITNTHLRFFSCFQSYLAGFGNNVATPRGVAGDVVMLQYLVPNK